MTKKDKFEIIRNIPAVAENEMLVEFIDREIELLAKKSGTAKKPTPTQVANESIKKAILATMEPNVYYTVTDIQKKVTACADLSNQKVSSLTNQLVADGLVKKTTEKRKSLFCLA